MKKILFVAATVITLGLTPVFAQGQSGQGPRFDGAMVKLFGPNQTYTADLEIQTSTENGGDVIMPGKLIFDHGKSRLEMNMSDVKSSQLPANAIQQMKAMGMDRIINITRPDLKMGYLIYPGLNSYAEIAARDSAGSANADDYKVDTTAQGKETVEGHECAKNTVTVTDKDGTKHQFTVWNATDMKNFPAKIETSDTGHPITMMFRNVSFSAPAASQFEAPTGLTKYTDVKTMMNTEMMKKFGGQAPKPN